MEYTIDGLRVTLTQLATDLHWYTPDQAGSVTWTSGLERGGLNGMVNAGIRTMPDRSQVDFHAWWELDHPYIYVCDGDSSNLVAARGRLQQITLGTETGRFGKLISRAVTKVDLNRSGVRIVQTYSAVREFCAGLLQGHPTKEASARVFYSSSSAADLVLTGLQFQVVSPYAGGMAPYPAYFYHVDSGQVFMGEIVHGEERAGSWDNRAKGIALSKNKGAVHWSGRSLAPSLLPDLRDVCRDARITFSKILLPSRTPQTIEELIAFHARNAFKMSGTGILGKMLAGMHLGEWTALSRFQVLLPFLIIGSLIAYSTGSRET